MHWDDDDWHAPWRLRYQVEALERGTFDICGVDHVLFVDARAGQAWNVMAPNSLRWVCGATLAIVSPFGARIVSPTSIWARILASSSARVTHASGSWKTIGFS